MFSGSVIRLSRKRRIRNVIIFHWKIFSCLLPRSGEKTEIQIQFISTVEVKSHTFREALDLDCWYIWPGWIVHGSVKPKENSLQNSNRKISKLVTNIRLKIKMICYIRVQKHFRNIAHKVGFLFSPPEQEACLSLVLGAALAQK